MGYVHEWRIRSLTKELKGYDQELFASREPNGIVCVWRKGHRYESVDGIFPEGLLVGRENNHLIFALTDDWTIHGIPVERGNLQVMERIRASDTQRRDLAAESIKLAEKRKENAKRHVRNETEAFFSDNRSQFARATNDIRTCNMDKKKDIRRIKGA